jgi:2-polyprenyl-3-methyl-5-hydroxy-6-metoxy-1,4-benzoquinol methylase
MKKQLYCDIDSTINNHWVRVKRNTNPFPGQTDPKAFTREEIMKDELLPNAKESLLELSEEWDIHFLSARNYKDSYQITKDWLDEKEVPYDSINIVNKAHDKPGFLLNKDCDLFIDDFSGQQKRGPSYKNLYYDIIKKLRQNDIPFLIFGGDWSTTAKEIQTMFKPWDKRFGLECYKNKERAERYRIADKNKPTSDGWKKYAANLKRICNSFEKKIDVLDIGCGTGRYFCSLTNVNNLYGLDFSNAMLFGANNPIDKETVTQNINEITLIQGDFNKINKIKELEGKTFDFVFSIGLLSEYGPTTELSCLFLNKVFDILNENGTVYFSIMHDALHIKSIINNSLFYKSDIQYSPLKDNKATKNIVEIRK